MISTLDTGHKRKVVKCCEVINQIFMKNESLLKFEEVHKLYVEYYGDLKLNEEAVFLLKKALKKVENENNGTKFSLQMQLADFMSKCGSHQKALRVYLDALNCYEKMPTENREKFKIDFRMISRNIGFCFLKEGETQKALEHFEKTDLSEAKDLDIVKFRRMLGSCYFQLGKKGEAVDNFKRAVSIKLSNEDKEVQNPDVLQIGLILALLKQRKRNNMEVLKKNIRELMEPRPQITPLFKAMSSTDISSHGVLFSNMLGSKCNWKMLSYSKNKNAKKNWRLFKNSALIAHHAR